MVKKVDKTLKTNFFKGCLPNYNDNNFNKIRLFFLDSLPYFGKMKVSSTQSIDDHKLGWKSQYVTKLFDIMLNNSSIDNRWSVIKNSKNHKIFFTKLKNEKIHNKTLKLNELVHVEKVSSDNKVLCIFRHIRNSIAHGRYKKIGEYIFFEDLSRSGNVITARIVLKEETIIKWITIFSKGI